jgi:hypothetical protein
MASVETEMHDMRYMVLAAVAVGAVAIAGGHAEAAQKKHRAYQTQESYPPYASPSAFQGDPGMYYGGNAAAAGNNANSMSGSNSAGNNAIGRTSGSGGRN